MARDVRVDVVVADCPACGLRGLPITNGLLAAHAWHRGTWADGPDDENGDPTPGEWRGGCHNRDPGIVPPETPG